MRVMLVLLAASLSNIFAGEVLANKGESALQLSKKALFKNLPNNAAAAILQQGILAKTKGAWLAWQKLSASEDEWWHTTHVKTQDRVTTPEDIDTLLSKAFSTNNPNKNSLGEELLVYVAVRHHSPTLLSVYKVVMATWPYEIAQVAHIDLAEGKELFQLPHDFVVEEALLEETDSFPVALGQLFSLHRTNLDTFAQQLQAAKNKHTGLFSGLIAELVGLQILDTAYLNSAAGVGEEAVHVSPPPYVNDVDEIANTLANSQVDKNTLRLLASTELIINDIEVLLREFDAETAMPQKIADLMREINATKVEVEARDTPVAEKTTVAAASNTTKEATETKNKVKKLPEVARPYGEFIKQARLSMQTKNDGDTHSLTWLVKKLQSNGFSPPRKTISNHEAFWSMPSHDYLQKMIAAGYAKLLDINRETLWKVWELSQQARDKDKIARKFGDFLKEKRKEAGYLKRSVLIAELIQDSHGGLLPAKANSLEATVSSYERYKVTPTEEMLQQLLSAGLADKIGVSGEELKAVWQEARQARKEAKKLAKEARALVHREVIAQEQPVVEKQPAVVVDAEPVPTSAVIADTTPQVEQTFDIELLIANLQTMQEQSSSPQVHELLGKEIERLEGQWLFEEEQRLEQLETEARTALEKVRGEVEAVKEQYSKQLGDRLDDIYLEVMRGL